MKMWLVIRLSFHFGFVLTSQASLLWSDYAKADMVTQVVVVSWNASVTLPSKLGDKSNMSRRRLWLCTQFILTGVIEYFVMFSDWLKYEKNITSPHLKKSRVGHLYKKPVCVMQEYLSSLCVPEIACRRCACDLLRSCNCTNWHRFLAVEKLQRRWHPVHTSEDELSPNKHSETHRVSSLPACTITRDDKYSSISKNQQCGAFAADWLGWDLHNAWAEITLNNNRFNMNGQFKIYGNKTVNKQQFKEQKSLSALIPLPQLSVLIVSLAYILPRTLHSHIYLQIGLLISAIMILHYHNK